MICVRTDAGAQTETAAQALYPQRYGYIFLSLPYYICLHIDDDYLAATPDNISVKPQ